MYVCVYVCVCACARAHVCITDHCIGEALWYEHDPNGHPSYHVGLELASTVRPSELDGWVIVWVIVRVVTRVTV